MGQSSAHVFQQMSNVVHHHERGALICMRDTQADAMIMFMWQDCIIGVVRCINECPEKVLYTSDQPSDASGWKM